MLTVSKKKPPANYDIQSNDCELLGWLEVMTDIAAISGAEIEFYKEVKRAKAIIRKYKETTI